MSNFDAEYNNPDNWSFGIYNSSKDTRIFVPKQVFWGWTLNFGNFWSYPTLALLVAAGLLAGHFIKKLFVRKLPTPGRNHRTTSPIRD